MIKQAFYFFPLDVRLDWRTFNYPEPDDKKIIDFKIWFGEAFPLLTEKTSDVSFKSSLRHLSEIPDSPTSQVDITDYQPIRREVDIKT